MLPGPAGKGDICLNGPPARHFQKGDKIIILAEAWVTRTEAKKIRTAVAFVDDKNAITELRNVKPGSKHVKMS